MTIREARDEEVDIPAGRAYYGELWQKGLHA